MTPEQKDLICNRALAFYGEAAQIIKCIEELGELTKALAKKFNADPDHLGKTIDNVHEEIADVEIMLAQMRMVFDSAAIDKFKEDKLERLKQRMGM